MLISYGEQRTGGQKNLLAGILCGGVPELSANLDEKDPKSLALVRTMAALHRRVALLEMTNHEFLDKERRRERTTFGDGTTVTVDWDQESANISGDLSLDGHSSK